MRYPLRHKAFCHFINIACCLSGIMIRNGSDWLSSQVARRFKITKSLQTERAYALSLLDLYLPIASERLLEFSLLELAIAVLVELAEGVPEE